VLEKTKTLDKQHFRETFKAFVAREITPFVRQWEAEDGAPRTLWQRMGKEGYLCSWVPSSHGGPGLSYEFSVIIGEELVRGDGFGLGMPLHNDVVTPYLYHYGSEQTIKYWLPLCRSGDVITAIAMTEPDAGSDLSAIRTTAIKKGDHYIINGRKTFITNGRIADLIVVAVKTDPVSSAFGTSLVVVPGDAPGLVRGRPLRKMGSRLAENIELIFDNCRVPSSNLLGREGFGARYLQERLPEERLEISIKCQVLAEEILKETLKYVKIRNVSGQRVGSFQHNAFRLAEMATEVKIGRTFVDRIIADYLAGQNIAVDVSMAKWWLSEMANRAANLAVQLHGAFGYSEDSRVARMYRDVRVTTIYAGTNEIMKTLISRRLGLRSA
jgi:acyl-CoA dehydrogenase